MKKPTVILGAILVVFVGAVILVALSRLLKRDPAVISGVIDERPDEEQDMPYWRPPPLRSVYGR